MTHPKWIITLIVILTLSACARMTGSHPSLESTRTVSTTTISQATLIPKAIVNAQQTIADQLDVEVHLIKIHQFDSAKWPDGCLGFPEANEVCTEAIITGYKGTVQMSNQEFVFHSNGDGSVVKLIPMAAMRALKLLAENEKAATEKIQISNIEAVDWPDTCLGIQNPDQLCAQVVTPGYQVNLQFNGKDYIFHTDLNGDLIYDSHANNQEVILTWVHEVDGNCLKVRFSESGIEWGNCDSDQQTIPFSNNSHYDEFLRFSKLYAPFTTKTQTGTIEFSGSGTVTTSDAQHRMLAEWSQFTFKELREPGIKQNSGFLLSYSTKAESSGRCEDVNIYLSGFAKISSCPGTTPKISGTVWLNDQQLHTIYHWADDLRSYEIQQTDLNADDVLTTQISFSGIGNTIATTIEQQEMRKLCDEFITQIKLEPDFESAQAATQALLDYINTLNQGNYIETANLYAGSYELLQSLHPNIEKDNSASLFQAGCEVHGLICNLALRNVISTVAISPDVYRISIELQNPDGTLFSHIVQNNDSSQETKVSQFNYLVQRNNQNYRILTLPAYSP